MPSKLISLYADNVLWSFSQVQGRLGQQGRIYISVNKKKMSRQCILLHGYRTPNPARALGGGGGGEGFFKYFGHVLLFFCVKVASGLS